MHNLSRLAPAFVSYFSVAPTVAAFTGVVFAALLYGLLHAADAAVRRQLCNAQLLVVAGLLAIILLLFSWVTLLDALRSGLGENWLIQCAAIGGLIVGKNMPRRNPRFLRGRDYD